MSICQTAQNVKETPENNTSCSDSNQNLLHTKMQKNLEKLHELHERVDTFGSRMSSIEESLKEMIKDTLAIQRKQQEEEEVPNKEEKSSPIQTQSQFLRDNYKTISECVPQEGRHQTTMDRMFQSVVPTLQSHPLTGSNGNYRHQVVVVNYLKSILQSLFQCSVFEHGSIVAPLAVAVGAVPTGRVATRTPSPPALPKPPSPSPSLSPSSPHHPSTRVISLSILVAIHFRETWISILHDYLKSIISQRHTDEQQQLQEEEERQQSNDFFADMSFSDDPFSKPSSVSISSDENPSSSEDGNLHNNNNNNHRGGKNRFFRSTTSASNSSSAMMGLSPKLKSCEIILMKTAGEHEHEHQQEKKVKIIFEDYIVIIDHNPIPNLLFSMLIEDLSLNAIKKDHLLKKSFVVIKEFFQNNHDLFSIGFSSSSSSPTSIAAIIGSSSSSHSPSALTSFLNSSLMTSSISAAVIAAAAGTVSSIADASNAVTEEETTTTTTSIDRICWIFTLLIFNKYLPKINDPFDCLLLLLLELESSLSSSLSLESSVNRITSSSPSQQREQQQLSHQAHQEEQQWISMYGIHSQNNPRPPLLRGNTTSTSASSSSSSGYLPSEVINLYWNYFLRFSPIFSHGNLSGTNNNSTSMTNHNHFQCFQNTIFSHHSSSSSSSSLPCSHLQHHSSNNGNSHSHGSNSLSVKIIDPFTNHCLAVLSNNDNNSNNSSQCSDRLLLFHNVIHKGIEAFYGFYHSKITVEQFHNSLFPHLFEGMNAMMNSSVNNHLLQNDGRMENLPSSGNGCLSLPVSSSFIQSSSAQQPLSSSSSSSSSAVYNELLASFSYCNMILHNIVNEQGILYVCKEILMIKGAIPVSEIGKYLIFLTNNNFLCNYVKEQYQGFKKFMERFSPKIFIFGNDSLHNPHVYLMNKVMESHSMMLISMNELPIEIILLYRKGAPSRKLMKKISNKRRIVLPPK